MSEQILEAIGKNTQYVMGNTACAYGAIIAGCRFFGGYPITPASEIIEKMSELLPQVGGKFIQMEDELSALASIIGASWTGAKAMTATSGPGFSLMQENLGYGIMTETPAVIVNVQRVGPSTGMPTLPSQGDLMQTRWGSHGDYEIIALASASVQETFELTIRAFNLAERYRTPVVLLMDAEVGHMREKLEIPEKAEIENRTPVTIDVDHYKPFRAGYTHPGWKVPEMDKFGDEYPTFVTGLTHDEMGYPATTDPDVHRELIHRLQRKILENVKEICILEIHNMEDAEIGIISYETTSRPCLSAMEKARKKGIKAGNVKLTTVWPLHEEKISRIAKKIDKLLVVEMNKGQIVREIRKIVAGKCEVEFLGKIGGEIISPQEIVDKIEEMMRDV
ncbi:2-oxoglutarate ferredoxin oxidoreductase subunit alpha [candidate division MSBL1 archaeon SCGC-AAA259J03]|uniref:2-oxoglutarate synthase subunit KorA n=2 Tax=candidate division MSBL1 TaxID=215777 RepID=A0A656YVX3_9EURY|nr:2-oxoglutarate ferredoxin oxidoreductase subunit alpha [candidate division MSBL1 archaeon SCGC-AAA259J03]